MKYGDVWVSVPLRHTENEYNIYNFSGPNICTVLASILYQVLAPCRCRLYWWHFGNSFNPHFCDQNFDVLLLTCTMKVYIEFLFFSPLETVSTFALPFNMYYTPFAVRNYLKWGFQGKQNIYDYLAKLETVILTESIGTFHVCCCCLLFIFWTSNFGCYNICTSN